MNFATIGSYMLDDIIRYAKDKMGLGFCNVGRYTCINPISLCFGGGFPEDVYDSYKMTCDNAYQRHMHRSDLKKTVFSEIKAAKPDYILFDLAEIFSPVKVFAIGDKRLAYTMQSHLIPLEKKLKEDQTILATALSPQGVLNYVSGYVGKLIEWYGEDKLILVKTYANYQFFDKRGKWSLSADLNDVTSRNYLLKNAYNYLEKTYKIKTFDLPELLFNDLQYNASGSYKLAEVYYPHLVQKLDWLVNGKGKKQFADGIADQIEEFVDGKTCDDLVQMANEYGVKKNKKIVLVGHSNVFLERLKDKLGVKPKLVIDYDRTTSEETLEKDLDQIADKTSEYYVVVPHLYAGSRAITSLMKKGFFPNVNIIGMHYFQYSIKVYGDFYDIYNNRIFSECADNAIKVKGKGATVSIGKIKAGMQVAIDCFDQSTAIIGGGISFVSNINFFTYWGARLQVGERSTFGAENKFWVYAGGEMSIGKDCMFADKITVQAGDGHAIYDLRTRKNINSDLNDYAKKIKVCLGDHIWVGREALLINCSIGDGSIVGARALVKKAFPNNCTIAGMPAKIIRKDVGWSREINCYDIDDPVFGVPAEYRNFTNEAE